MKLLWFTWKDLKHPLAGGAEVVNEELAKRLVADGHEVTLLVGGYKGCTKEEVIDGYRVIRLGNRYSLYWLAYRYYKKHLIGWADLVIDEINTVPFFAKFYVREPNILFVHMLCRRIWFYQLIFPLSLAGYLVEPLYLGLLADRKVITISDSTKQDLIRHGFKPENITIISEGIRLRPVKDVSKIKKYSHPTLLSLGSIRPMKRTAHQIKAFEIAKQSIPDLQLKVAGDASGHYGKKVLRMIARSPYHKDIEYLGKVTEAQKIELMQKSHLILVTSIKEGWGLIVTEAASQGTPTVVYNVDGLRDSVQPEVTGLVCAVNTPKAMAINIVKMLQNSEQYAMLRQKAWVWSHQISFDQSYQDFRTNIIGRS